jgi:hypothetical protein
MKLGNNSSDTCAMLSEAYGGEAMKSRVFLSGINGSKGVRLSKSQMRTIISTFFDVNVIAHFNSYHKTKQSM